MREKNDDRLFLFTHRLSYNRSKHEIMILVLVITISYEFNRTCDSTRIWFLGNFYLYYLAVTCTQI